ncbi:restriction endonuclease subunit S [Sporosarcina sp. ACRSM]|uniref:restriction endonuclease subunit S n=1 Tax=Sporosarcina sp. ACRSM TaxID=2918216 RepID=UPI001EF6887C|nr:restriction endonuclease subunit S [Sporosarcina sp. ACRSM]MCG7333699.1 restriction endonuclease subunit S [Sporosarcina sp. ACRSM]
MSEVREGYKMTELGEIPSEWEIVQFKECCSIVSGLVDPNNEIYREYPHIGNANIEKESGKLLEYSLVKDENLISGKFLFNENHVLYGKINPHFAKATYPRFKGLCSADMYPIDVNNEILTPEYLLYSILDKRFTKAMTANSARTGIPKVNKQEIDSFKFVLPSIQEQQKIASILSTVDNQIDETEQLIVITKELKKGLMQKLLTKGIGHTEFKQTELGEIPEQWEYILLDTVAERKSGHTPDKKVNSYWNGNIPWISLKDTYRLDNRYVEETTDYTTIEGINNSSAVLLPINTVIILRDATVGKIGIMRHEMATSQHFINYICGEKLNPIFLYYYLLSKKKLFQRIAIGSTIKTIGLPFFKKFKITLPSIQEQEKIAQTLSTVDDQIDTYEQEKEKYEELKKGLMQQLLTGQIRLKI